VNIYASKVVKQMAVDPLFKAFPFFGGMGDSFLFGMPIERVQKSLGSGVMIRKNGLVVTNFHVIDGAQEIRVVLNDNREFKAQIVMSDKNADLALLKIEGEDAEFPFVEIRDADELKVGDDVLAIGNPYGIGQSSSRGIVSALASRFGGVKDFRSYIQTDAAVNKGNSGGALISLEESDTGDLKGRLVGITTAIASSDGGFQGVSFAVPSNMIHPLVSSYERGLKTIERAWVGVSVQSIDFNMAKSLGLSKPMGVLLTGVYPGSPGDQNGLKVGDLITHVNGKSIIGDEEYHFRVSVSMVGDDIKISYIREGQTNDLTLKLVAPPEDPARDLTVLTGNNPLNGATIVNLSPALASEISMDPMKTGVMVFEVKRNSIAHRLGLLPGDIIVTFNDQEIKLVKDLTLAVSIKKSQWILQCKRGDKTRVIKVSPNGTFIQENG
jgi:serine protease Do